MKTRPIARARADLRGAGHPPVQGHRPSEGTSREPTPRPPRIHPFRSPPMCEFFVKTDPILYESRTRTVRVHGVLTSIRLENLVWDTLAQMAADESCTTNALIARFHDEILEQRGDVQNFSSFLRVTCLRYLQRRCDQATRLGGAASDAEAPSLPAPVIALNKARPRADAGLPCG